MLKIGEQMPEFELMDQNGELFNSKDLKGKKCLIYFYPKDDTPGCTTEACGFRDIRYELQDKGIEIIGISKDSEKLYKKFADKYKLNFTLLSDDLTERMLQKINKIIYLKVFVFSIRIVSLQ